jgi:hypothetical protein
MRATRPLLVRTLERQGDEFGEGKGENATAAAGSSQQRIPETSGGRRGPFPIQMEPHTWTILNGLVLKNGFPCILKVYSCASCNVMTFFGMPRRERPGKLEYQDILPLLGKL